MTGWLKLAAFITAYEVRHRRDGRLLSEEADRWIVRRPFAARVLIVLVGVVLTAHLANLVPRPERYDVMATDFILWRQLQGR